MRQSTLSSLDLTEHSPDAPPLLQPLPPLWVTDAMPGARVYAAGPDVSVTASGTLVLLSTTIQAAGRMDASGLRAAVARAYASLGNALRGTGGNAIRLWNYLPDPGYIMEPGLDRYMVFNTGRYDGFQSWFEEPGGFKTSFVTASGVGIAGDDLVVHCLASDANGRAVENPRQKPAWRYSARYGPMPPSFSRATIAAVGGRQRLLIGGTASIVGEDSLHVGNVSAQLEETFLNLASLVAAARASGEPSRNSLARITDVRVYMTRGEDGPGIRAAVGECCPNAARIEMAVARLCRPELLVEIEGVAEM